MEVSAPVASDRHRGKWVLLALAVVSLGAMLLYPAFGQDASYHCFADTRGWRGIPNAYNVLSNLPFLVPGLLGLYRAARAPRGFRRTALFVLFASVGATCFGSGFYHLAPSDLRLIGDRFFIAVGFMALFALVIADRVDQELGRRLFWPLTAIGALSAIGWSWTHDLRPYYLVQGGSAGAIILLLFCCPRGLSSGLLWAALGLYVIAKLCEREDHAIWLVSGQAWSGHTLKHLFAAAAALALVGALRPVGRSGGSRAAARTTVGPPAPGGS